MLRVVKNISLNSFMLGYLPAVREKDLIIFSGAVKKVDMNRELKGEDDKLLRISSMTGDKECCAVLHADFIAGNGCFNSALAADKGVIAGVSDEINSATRDKGGALRCFELSCGRVGIILGEDLFYPELWARMALCAPSLVICFSPSYRAGLYSALAQLCDCGVCAVSPERCGVYSDGGALIKSSFEDFAFLPLPQSRRRARVLTRKVRTSIERP